MINITYIYFVNYNVVYTMEYWDLPYEHSEPLKQQIVTYSKKLEEQQCTLVCNYYKEHDFLQSVFRKYAPLVNEKR